MNILGSLVGVFDCLRTSRFSETRKMLSQRSLLLLMVLGLVSSLPQPFKWAKIRKLPKAPISNPLPKDVQETPNVPLETPGKSGAAGSPEIQGLNPPPIINPKDSLPLPKGDTSGDKPILPGLGVPGSTEIPGQNLVPITDEKGSLPLPAGDLPVRATTVGNKPIVPALGVPEVPGSPEVPELNPLSITKAKTCLHLPKEDLSVKDKAELGGLPEVPELNSLPITNAKDSLPVAAGDISVTAAVGNKLIEPEVPEDLIDNVKNGEKINLPNADVQGLPETPALSTVPNISPKVSLPIAKRDLVANPATGKKPNVQKIVVPRLSETSKWNDVYRHINRLEAVLKLEARIQVAGDKIMASSGKEVDFATSKSICKSVGGQIATPKNEAENNAVLAFVKKYNSYAYLGMREGSVPGVFTYLNGNQTEYTNWRKGEPRGKGKENCIEMYTDGQWNDKACNQKRLTVCEL